jgi:hypothetical protein
MKKTLVIIIAFISFNTSEAQKVFNTTDLVDEFGDKIGVVQRNIATGAFSNSATSSSSLKVRSILTQAPTYNSLEDYQEMLKNTYTGKRLKTVLKYSKKVFGDINNNNGKISFHLYEYDKLKASMIGVESGLISIKTKNGTKIKATLEKDCFSDGSVTITGFKELTTKGLGSVETKIKHLSYDWGQSDIYKSITDDNSSTDIVIYFGNSTYRFTIE